MGAFPPNEPKKNLKIKDFLKFTVVKYNNSHFDVITLIKTCANRLGGVHIGEEDKDEPIEKEVRELGELLKQLGLNGAFSAMIIIGSTVQNALKPIIEKIK
ncbi:MAG: hypothetical protein VR65_05980 [Desulfobulbaceae bacterium BRH_c16a]|nr:MAG: hypothetical protein VR65_05980 [Desulfobulbaceae bacterium BRH_c16a]